MNALLIAALVRARLAARPVPKSAWSDDHRNPHVYAPHDAITREGVRALATEGFFLELSGWREEKTDGGLLLVANMGLWHSLTGTLWPMTPWKEPLEGGADRGKAWHAAQVAARAYAHREVCSLEVLDESRAASAPAPAPAPAATVAPTHPLPPPKTDEQLHEEMCAAFDGHESVEAWRAATKGETEAKLRAGAAMFSPEAARAKGSVYQAMCDEEDAARGLAPITDAEHRAKYSAPGLTNGNGVHLDPDPTMPPTKRGELLTLDPSKACPVCKGKAASWDLCDTCGRNVCARCFVKDPTTEAAGLRPSCEQCFAADGDSTPPYISPEDCARAREMFDDPTMTLGPEAVAKALGTEVLGVDTCDPSMGLLLKTGSACWRATRDDLEDWLRGPGDEERSIDECPVAGCGAFVPGVPAEWHEGSLFRCKEGHELVGVADEEGGHLELQDETDELDPTTKGEDDAAVAASEPTPASTSPAGSPSNPDEEAPGTSPGSSGCKTAASSPTPPSPGGASSPVGPNFLDQEEWSGVTNPEPSASSSSPEASSPAASPAASPPGAPAVQSPAEASGGGAPLRCPDCLVDVPEVVGFVDHLGPCPSCETELRLVEGQPSWLEVPELLLGFLEHVPTKRKVKYGTRRGRSVTVAVHPGAGVDTVDVTDLRAWEEPEAPPAPKGKKEKPSKAPPGPVGIPEDEEQRKALGAAWCAMKRHTATKKAPDEDCPLCEQALRIRDVYRVGKASLGKRLAHDACVAKLLDGRDPRVNERHQIEREAIDRLTPAGAPAGGGQ